MTAQARVSETLGLNFSPGTLTALRFGNIRATLYRSADDASRMMGNNPSVWHDELIFVINCAAVVNPNHYLEWLALIVVGGRIGYV